MKILIINLAKKFGGADTRALALLKFGSNKWSIGLAALEGSPVANQAARLNIPVYIIGKSKYDPRLPFRIRKLIIQNQYDILDCQNPQSKLWSWLAVLFSNIVLVSTLNSWYLNEHNRSLKGWLYHLLELASKGRTDAYQVVAKQIAFAAQAWGIKKTKIYPALNAVDIKWPEKQPELRSKLGISDTDFLLISVGRLTFAKGYEYMLQALTFLEQDIHWLVVGGGELEKELISLTHELGLEQRVHWFKQQLQEKIPSFLQQADAFIMPSVSEGTPYALLEAACLALPIVATRVGGIPRFIHNKKNGLLVASADPKALAKAVIWMKNNRARASCLGRAAQKEVAASFSPAKMLELADIAYSQAFENRRKKIFS